MELTKSNYHSKDANREYYSASQVKSFLSCQYAAVVDLFGGRETLKTTSLLVGGFVDAHFSGEMEEFCEQNPEIFTRSGQLRSEYRKAQDIIERIESDKLAMMMLDGEKQSIFTGEIAGKPFKIKTDVILSAEQCVRVASEFPRMGWLMFEEGAIVDLKIMKDFAPLYRPGEGKMSFIEYWLYDLQGSIYQEIVKQSTGKKLPFLILSATKQDPPDINLFRVGQSEMDARLEALVGVMPDIDAVKTGKEEATRCENCVWCRASRILSGAMESME